MSKSIGFELSAFSFPVGLSALNQRQSTASAALEAPCSSTLAGALTVFLHGSTGTGGRGGGTSSGSKRSRSRSSVASSTLAVLLEFYSSHHCYSGHALSSSFAGIASPFKHLHCPKVRL